MTHDYSLLTNRREAALPPKPFILISRTPLSCKKRKENCEKQEDTISRFWRCFRFRGLSVSIRGQRKSVSTFRHGKTPKTQCFRRFLAPPARLERTTSRLGDRGNGFCGVFPGALQSLEIRLITGFFIESTALSCYTVLPVFASFLDVQLASS